MQFFKLVFVIGPSGVWTAPGHHPVSILQLEGQKRWWYSREPRLKQVISNISFPVGRDLLKLPWVTVQRPTEESLCEVEPVRPFLVGLSTCGTYGRHDGR
jgi:hypothetical protein